MIFLAFQQSVLQATGNGTPDGPAMIPSISTLRVGATNVIAKRQGVSGESSEPSARQPSAHLPPLITVHEKDFRSVNSTTSRQTLFQFSELIDVNGLN